MLVYHKKILYYLIGIISLILCIICLLLAFVPKKYGDTVKKINDVKITQNQQIDKQDNLTNGKYKSPINFSALKENNDEVYGWIFIPDTNIDCPILQSQTDDTFYLSHDSMGEKNKAGAIFTEHQYNSIDFEDPLTLIYGHKMRSGDRFGLLQSYFDTKSEMLCNNQIIIYLPEKELHYQVFAAVPYSAQHILSKYNFNDKSDYHKFIREIYTLQGVFDESVSINSSDKIICLSTCLRGNHKRRFIVLAKLQ